MLKKQNNLRYYIIHTASFNKANISREECVLRVISEGLWTPYIMYNVITKKHLHVTTKRTKKVKTESSSIMLWTVLHIFSIMTMKEEATQSFLAKKKKKKVLLLKLKLHGIGNNQFASESAITSRKKWIENTSVYKNEVLTHPHAGRNSV